MKYRIETFGCQMNFHDSEILASLLEQAGYEATDRPDEADVVVLNTCSVRERAEEKLYSRLGEIREMASRRPRKPLVTVAGCVAQQEGGRLLKGGRGVDLVLGTRALHRLPALLEEARTSGSRQLDVRPYEDVALALAIPKREDPVRALVTIIEGCNDFCSFCVVPYTRGHERVRPKARILEDVREAAASGRREVQLLGQIVNHYQAPDDPACDFPGLLEAVHEVPGIDRIRFASPHPRHVSDHLVTAVRDLPKVCKHLHLPVQSGSSAVLRRMRRRHTREEYLSLVDRIRTQIPDIMLSTDVIVGFPGETEDDFAETLSLTRLVRFQSMYSFKYSERPNTLAARRMPDTVPEAEKGRRLAELQELQRQIQWELHRRAVGETVEVLIDSRSRRRESELSGRTTGNMVVNLPGRLEWLGTLRHVTIQRAGPNSVWGEVRVAPATP